MRSPHPKPKTKEVLYQIKKELKFSATFNSESSSETFYSESSSESSHPSSETSKSSSRLRV